MIGITWHGLELVPVLLLALLGRDEPADRLINDCRTDSDVPTNTKQHKRLTESCPQPQFWTSMPEAVVSAHANWCHFGSKHLLFSDIMILHVKRDVP